MSFLFRVLLLPVFLFASTFSRAQAAQSAEPDTKAEDILAQAMAASGTANVQALTATGTITYFWAGQAVQCNATIRAKGGDQFRLDADVPGGTRSVALSGRSGSRKDADGKLSEIPAHNTLNVVIPTFPYLSIAAALADSTMSISYVGLAENEGRQFHQVRVDRIFSKESDPEGLLAPLSAVDYFVDTQTSLVAKVSDLTHPKETLTESYTHELEFEGYTAMSGIAVPTIVREKVGGQTSWELRVSTIALNSDLSDADFSLR